MPIRLERAEETRAHAGNNLPPYLKIAQSIRREVARKGLAPHTRLPSEPELVKRFGAARATVRRALANLQQEGLIYSRQAVGTFVAEPRVEQDLNELFSFTEFLVYRGLKPGTRLLEAEVRRIVQPGSPVLHHLRLRPGARVIFLRRLRLANGQPLVIANTWLPAARFRGFLSRDLKHHSVYETMEAMGLKPTDAVQSIEAITLGSAEASLLMAPPGSPALLIRRVGYARDIPVEYAVDYYRGERTRFHVRLGVLERHLSEHDGFPHIVP
ncbi:MAG: GntR family transcriptional regulator [Terriglobia bacterium]